MIAAVLFVLAFLVVGLAVLAFAFGGRAGTRYRRGAPTRAGRRFVAVVVALVIVLVGVAVPQPATVWAVAGAAKAAVIAASRIRNRLKSTSYCGAQPPAYGVGEQGKY